MSTEVRTCAECAQLFEPHQTAPRQLFCSKGCKIKSWRKQNRAKLSAGHARWIAKNREANRAYQKEWRLRNNNAERDNAPRRKSFEYPDKTCLQCGNTFQKRKGPAKFCSVKCRSKYSRSKPGKKEKQKLRAKVWIARNIEKHRAYHRHFYQAGAAKKHALHPWKSLLNGAKKRAKNSNKTFTITETWAAQRWRGRCELTNIPFCSPEERVGYKHRNFGPSIDRIRPEEGYTPDNCRFVLWAINSFKRDSSDEDMYRIAQALISNCSQPAEAVLALPG